MPARARWLFGLFAIVAGFSGPASGVAQTLDVGELPAPPLATGLDSPPAPWACPIVPDGDFSRLLERGAQLRDSGRYERALSLTERALRHPACHFDLLEREDARDTMRLLRSLRPPGTEIGWNVAIMLTGIPGLAMGIGAIWTEVVLSVLSSGTFRGSQDTAFLDSMYAASAILVTAALTLIVVRLLKRPSNTAAFLAERNHLIGEVRSRHRERVRQSRASE